MSDIRYLDWPFFEPHHRVLARKLEAWSVQHLSMAHASDVDHACKSLVRALGEGGWLTHAIAASGGAIDTRAICLIRETLARHSGLADFAFAMQGLGSGAISLHGSAAQRERYLPRVARGEAIAAFALSEPEAGSDVAAMACSARLDGDSYVLEGEKTWISNGGIADFYVVFARTGEAPGARGISAFIVDADTPGLSIAERIEVMAPHPLARLHFGACRVRADQRLGASGEGFKIAMRTLDVFRTSVAAAALGFARRALDEALLRATTRKMFKGVLADFQLTQARLALGPADLSRRVDARPGPQRHARGRHGQDDRHRERAAGHRRGGADVGRPGCGQRSGGRAALPRDPRPAHLRGRDRSAAAHHRP